MSLSISRHQGLEKNLLRASRYRKKHRPPPSIPKLRTPDSPQSKDMADDHQNYLKLPELDSSVAHRHVSCSPQGDLFFAMSPRRQILRLPVGKTVLEVYAGVSAPVGIVDGHRLTHASFGEVYGQIDATNPEGLLSHIIYVPDSNSHIIRLIQGDEVSTLAGIANTFGSRDGRTNLAVDEVGANDQQALLNAPLSAVCLTSCPAVLIQDKNGLRFLSTITGYITTVHMACKDSLNWVPRMLVEPVRDDDSYQNPGILLVDLITPRLKTPYRVFVPAEQMERLRLSAPAAPALVANVVKLKSASKYRNMQGVPIAALPCSEMSYTRGLLYDVKVQDKSVSANSWLVDCRPLAQVAHSNILVYRWNAAGTVYLRRDIDATPSYDRFPVQDLTALLANGGSGAVFAPIILDANARAEVEADAEPDASDDELAEAMKEFAHAKTIAAATASPSASPVPSDVKIVHVEHGIDRVVRVWDLHSAVLSSNFGIGPWDFSPFSAALNKLPSASVEFVIKRLYGSTVAGTVHQLCHLAWVFQTLGMDVGALRDELRTRLSQLSPLQLWNLMTALQQEPSLSLTTTDDLMILMVTQARSVTHRGPIQVLVNLSPVATQYTIAITTLLDLPTMPLLSVRPGFRTSGLAFKRTSAMYVHKPAIALQRLADNSPEVFFVMYGVTGEGWYITASLVHLYPFWRWIANKIDALPKPLSQASRIIAMPQNWTIPMVIALLQTFHSLRRNDLSEDEAFQVLFDAVLDPSRPYLGLSTCPAAASFVQHAESVCFPPPTRATLFKQIIFAHKLGRDTTALVAATAAHNYSQKEIKAALVAIPELDIRMQIGLLLMGL